MKVKAFKTVLFSLSFRLLFVCFFLNHLSAKKLKDLSLSACWHVTLCVYREAKGKVNKLICHLNLVTRRRCVCSIYRIPPALLSYSTRKIEQKKKKTWCFAFTFNRKCNHFFLHNSFIRRKKKEKWKQVMKSGNELVICIETYSPLAANSHNRKK